MNRDHCSSCELGNEQSVSIQKEILDSETLGLKGPSLCLLQLGTWPVSCVRLAERIGCIRELRSPGLLHSE